MKTEKKKKIQYCPFLLYAIIYFDIDPLYCTGYTNKMSTKSDITESYIPIVEKPYLFCAKF
jgi:hypothetical protein